MCVTKKNLIQIFIWVLWFASQSISSLADIENFPVWPSVYNYLSLVAVFYLTYYATSSLCNSISVYKAAKMKGVRMVQYILWRPQTFFIIGIAFAYPICSWFYDGFMVKMNYLPYRFPDFFKYTEGRWGREGLYLCMAVLIAVFVFMYRRKDGIIRSQRAQNKLLLNHLMQNDRFLKDLDEEVKRFMNEQQGSEE